MKKHLIAAAVAAAVAVPAMAQNVEIYGVLDVGYTSTKTDADINGGANLTNKTTTTGDGGAWTSSRLGFRGTEDLGKGLKAGFVYEMGMTDSDNATGDSTSTDVGSLQRTRLSNVFISGGFGSVRLGRSTTIAEMAWGTGDVGGGNNFIGRAYTSAYRLANSRSDRLIEYTSPTFSGFTVMAQYGKRKDDNENLGGVTSAEVEHKETGFGLRYAAGPLNAMVGYVKEKADGGVALAATTAVSIPGDSLREIIAGVNYDFGVAKVFFTHVDGNGKNVSLPAQGTFGAAAASATAPAGGAAAGLIGVDKFDTRISEIGAAFPMGALTLNVSYYDGKIDGREGAGKGKIDIDGYQLAALYSFSKRTTGYIAYGSADADFSVSGAGGIVDFNTKQYGLGIRHSF